MHRDEQVDTVRIPRREQKAADPRERVKSTGLQFTDEAGATERAEVPQGKLAMAGGVKNLRKPWKGLDASVVKEKKSALPADYLE